MQIAESASQGQIIGYGQTTMFFTDDMIDVTAKEGIVFVNKTIFTNALSPGYRMTAQFHADISFAHAAR